MFVVPESESNPLAESVVVPMLPNVLTPVKYGMLPMTAAVEVESPLKPSVTPESVIGNVTPMVACLAFHVAAEVILLSASVPIQYGVNKCVVPLETIVIPRFVSAVEVERVCVAPVSPV